MNKKITKWMESLLSAHRSRRVWIRCVSVLACVVIFCTVYALILPAITLEKKTASLVCPFTSHVHSEECYEDGVLICGKSDVVIHVHDENCYDDKGVLICDMPEIQEHIHDETCYGEDGEPICGKQQLTAHVHSEECYEDGVLICGKTEVMAHQHESGCFKELDPDDEPSATADRVENTSQDEESSWRDEDESLIYEEDEPDLSAAANGGISLMSLLPEEEVASGSFGEDDALTWTVSKNDRGEYTLKISGEGDMPDFATAMDQPWRDYYTNINKIVIEDKVTKIGQSAFQNLAASEVSIGTGVQSIGALSFGYMNNLVDITIPGNVKKIDRAFSYSKNLQKVVFEEGTESIYLSGLVGTSIGSSGNTIDLPSTITEIVGVGAQTVGYTIMGNGSASFYTDEYGALYKRTSDTTAALVAYPTHGKYTSYTVPENVTAIQGAVFNGNKTLRELTILSTVTGNISPQTFRESALEKVVIEDGVKIPDTTYLFYGCTQLNEVTLPSDVKIMGDKMFAKCTSLQAITIKNGIERLYNPFSECVSIEEFVYNAENCNYIYAGYTSDLPIYNLTIGKDVEVLPGTKVLGTTSYNGFSDIASHAQRVVFEGPNYITVEEGALSGAPASLSTLSGTLYIDENGIVYRYEEENQIAVLVYCPDGLESVEIPSSIISKNGTECVVNRIGKFAFSADSALKSVSVQNPSGIKTIGERAFYNCTKLNEIKNADGGKLAKTVSEALAFFDEATVGRRAFENTDLIQDSLDELGTITEENMSGIRSLPLGEEGSITVASDKNTLQWKDKDGEEKSGGYHLLTGDSLTVTISTGNTSASKDTRYRVYFELTEESGVLTIVPGNTYTIDGKNVTCYATEDSNIVYLDFGSSVGATFSIPVSAVYPNITSGGGGLRVWGLAYDPNNSDINPDDRNIILPAKGEKIEAHWRTVPDEFVLTKTSSADVSLTGDGNGGTKPAGNLAWEIALQREQENSTLGKDLVYSVEYEDLMSFPSGISWSDEVMSAIRDGNVRRSGEYIYAGDIQVCRLQVNSGVVAGNVDMSLNENDQPVISYTIRKIGTDSEMSDNKINVTINAEALSVDLSRFEESGSTTIQNTAKAKLNYTYSSVQNLTASAVKNVKVTDAGIKVSKTADAVAYFGEDFNYTLKVLNDGSSGYPSLASDRDEITDVKLEDTLSQFVYIKPEHIDEMLDNAGGNLVLTISNAILAVQESVTGYQGDQAWKTSANTSFESVLSNAVLTVSLNPILEEEDKKIKVEISCGEKQEIVYGATAEEALRKVGYAVNREDVYSLAWQLPCDENGVRLEGGEQRQYLVSATVKDTFMLLNNDEPSSYPVGTNLTILNTAKVMEYRDNVSKQVSASSTTRSYVKKEVDLNKSVKKNGIEQSYGFTVANGDVMQYQIDFTHYGNGVYKNLPLVDDLYGVQFLVVLQSENSSLKECGLEEIQIGDDLYYKLKEGTYHDVVVGVDDEGKKYTADTITVSKQDGESSVGVDDLSYFGLHTQIKWYYPELSDTDNYYVTVDYQTVVDTSLAENNTNYSVGNIVWLNDKEGSRLYALTWGGGTVVEFDKDIVLEKGEVPAEDKLVEEKHSLIAENDRVIYRLRLTNKEDYPTTLNGSALADALPNNGGCFTWSKENVSIAVMADEGVSVSGIEKNWEISDTWGSAALSEGQQYILWKPDEDQNETAVIKFGAKQSVYIYVTLQFPSDKEESSQWSDYCDALHGNSLENTLYVYRYPVQVTHELKEKGEVLLQKGVYGTYYYGANSYYYAQTSSRVFYNNKDYRNRAIAYYVVLYNGGNKRMYLDDLVDVLPAGFSYIGLVADAKTLGKSTVSPVNMITTTSSGNTMLVEDNSAFSNVSYKNAIVEAISDTDGSLSFHISKGSGTDPIKFDEALQRCYLDKEEAVVFGYICDIGEAAYTDDHAKNVIGMKVLDLQGSGTEVVSDDEILFHGTETDVYLTFNDGQCETSLHAGNAGLPAEDGQMWLLSDVTVSRGEIIPGINKYTESYTANGYTSDYVGSVLPEVTVNWRSSLRNSGAYSITDYTFIDIMPSPYVFEGNVRLAIYDGSGSLIANGSNQYINLFAIGSRTDSDGEINLNTYNYSGNSTIEDPLSFDEEGEYMCYVGNVKVPFKLKLDHDENGNERMTLTLESRYFSIPEGGHVDIFYSSRNPTNSYNNQSYVNQAVLKPNLQQYDHASSGTLLEDEAGNPDGVSNYSPVTVAFGYSTSSNKEVVELNTDTSNKAVASNSENNQILLAGKDSVFRYTLSITNNSDVNITKLVVIDNLPQPNDHSAFDASVGRGSGFKVKLAKNPNWEVRTCKNEDDEANQAILTQESYHLQFSSNTEFSEEDWSGNSQWEDAVSEDTRSFRIVIEDNTGVLLMAGATVEISFDAVIDGDAAAGDIAWNSFGYQYNVANAATPLSALSLRVGVKVPEIPTLQKKLINKDGDPLILGKEDDFEFILYEGNRLEGSFANKEQLIDGLNSKRIPYKIITLPVQAGKSESEKLLLSFEDWSFVQGKTYTIVEFLPNGKYTLTSWCGAAQNYWTFVYDQETSVNLICVNAGSSFELPKTGASGTLAYRNGGIFLLLAGAWILCIRRFGKGDG